MNQEVNNAYEVLSKGGIILYPTDTIWGLGCDATNEKAVAKIYEIKKRIESKSMIILLENINRIYSYVDDVPDIAFDLIEAAVNPITIIYPGAKNLAQNLLSEDKSIGIRIPQDEFCLQLLKKFRKPIVSTSANISGEKSALNFSEIKLEISEKVDYIVKWRQNETKNGKASSIIKLEKGNVFKIIRE